MTSAAAPLLRYDLTTDPFPLQAKPATGKLSPATLTIVVSNPNADPDNHSVLLQGLLITIPLGQDGTDLAADSKGINPIPPDGWKLDSQPSSGTYLFRPLKGTYPVKRAGLTFVFDIIELSPEPGTAAVVVTEGSGNCQPPNC